MNNYNKGVGFDAGTGGFEGNISGSARVNAQTTIPKLQALRDLGLSNIDKDSLSPESRKINEIDNTRKRSTRADRQNGKFAVTSRIQQKYGKNLDAPEDNINHSRSMFSESAPISQRSQMISRVEDDEPLTEEKTSKQLLKF